MHRPPDSRHRPVFLGLHEGLDLSAYENNATNSDPVLNYPYDTLPDMASAWGST